VIRDRGIARPASRYRATGAASGWCRTGMTAAYAAAVLAFAHAAVSLYWAAGSLVLSGAVRPAAAVDRTALRWHVLVWDTWFLVWESDLRSTSCQPEDLSCMSRRSCGRSPSPS